MPPATAAAGPGPPKLALRQPAAAPPTAAGRATSSDKPPARAAAKRGVAPKEETDPGGADASQGPRALPKVCFQEPKDMHTVTRCCYRALGYDIMV